MALEIPSSSSGGIQLGSSAKFLPHFEPLKDPITVLDSVSQQAFEDIYKSTTAAVEQTFDSEITPEDNSNSGSEVNNHEKIPFPLILSGTISEQIRPLINSVPTTLPLCGCPSLLGNSSVPASQAAPFFGPSALNSSLEGVAAKHIGLGCLPGQSRHLYKRKGCRFTLMVAGVSGSGKTTFINTLFGDQLIKHDPITATSHIATHRFLLVENGFQLDFTAVDTPGFGQQIDNRLACLPLVNYVEEQYTQYMYQMEQPERSKAIDTRVHCCLYFITPSGTELTPLDILTMLELSKRVNVIPVIAKSDTLSSEDLLAFKKIVRECLISSEIGVCDFIMDPLVVNSINESVPFAIIGSNKLHINNQGETIRGRKYKWGIADVANADHCDFLALRSLLMSSNMLDLITSTDFHYENFRSESLADRTRMVLKNEKGFQVESSTNGLAQYPVYNKFPIQVFKKRLTLSNTLYSVLEKTINDRNLSTTRMQEARFKEWKRVLVEMQDELNGEIENLHKILTGLKAEIEVLGLAKNLLRVELATLTNFAFEPIETSSLSEEEFMF